MIAIYRGEDTDFGGAEPFQIKINTPLDLTGYTAKLLFGSIVKEFGPEDVGTKILPLSFTAEETSGFFPGRGFASVKVYDTDGRVAILKRFVIDVRFRSLESTPLDSLDISETIHAFENVREVAMHTFKLTDQDSMETVKHVINALLAAARRRDEFSPIPAWALAELPKGSLVVFMECVHRLSALAKDAEDLPDEAAEAEIKERLNAILAVFGGGKPALDDPKASLLSILDWAKEVNKILKTQKV